MSNKVAIIGAGLSGLACAVELKRNGISTTIYEASESIGGRVKTDNIDGFLLDHGFQVYLPSYELGKYFLDYDRLDLKAFSPGANIYKDGKFHSMSDPLRDPTKALPTIFSSLATIKDKALTAKLIFASKIDYEKIKTTQTALEYLSQYGFSQQYIHNFFIPFFSGVFLTKDLSVPADYFKFLFQCFSKSLASLPKLGMAQIPKQMVAELDSNSIRLNSKIDAESLLQEGYEHVFVSHPEDKHFDTDVQFYGVKTEYYKSRSTRYAYKTLYLNADPNAIVNHVACLTAVSSSYAPDGWQLYSVNILDGANGSSKKDLIKLFGAEEIKTWEHIKSYHIKKALPSKALFGSAPAKQDKNISYCGDYLESPSIQGALYSGRKVATAYLNNIGDPL